MESPQRSKNQMVLQTMNGVPPRLPVILMFEMHLLNFSSTGLKVVTKVVRDNQGALLDYMYKIMQLGSAISNSQRLKTIKRSSSSKLVVVNLSNSELNENQKEMVFSSVRQGVLNNLANLN